MNPVAWIKIRELSYMKAVVEHGKYDWQTNLGLKPEPDDEGLYTETQVQKMRESFEQSHQTEVDAIVKDSDRAFELLRRAETEMRYAGWTKYEADNSARNGVYEQIKQFLKKPQ